MQLEIVFFMSTYRATKFIFVPVLVWLCSHWKQPQVIQLLFSIYTEIILSFPADHFLGHLSVILQKSFFHFADGINYPEMNVSCQSPKGSCILPWAVPCGICPTGRTCSSWTSRGEPWQHFLVGTRLVVFLSSARQLVQTFFLLLKQLMFHNLLLCP